MQLTKVVQGFKVGDPVKVTNNKDPKANGRYVVIGFKGQELQLVKRTALTAKIKEIISA